MASGFKWPSRPRAVWFFAAALLFLTPPAPAMALDEPYDHSLWDKFLKKFVNEKGEVHYGAVKADPGLLDAYLLQIASIEDQFKVEWPREEKLALWLNAYHAGLIKIASEHYPIKSIQAIPGVWTADLVKVAGHFYSLNTLREGILLGAFRDEKIHAALSSGARSSPRLSREAYTGPRVEGQLLLAARRFVSDPELNKIRAGEKKIYLSKIFKWYAQDFSLDFGVPENDRDLSVQEYAVLSFAANYHDDPEIVSYLEDSRYKIKYLPFDWSLNDWRTGQSTA